MKHNIDRLSQHQFNEPLKIKLKTNLYSAIKSEDSEVTLK